MLSLPGRDEIIKMICHERDHKAVIGFLNVLLNGGTNCGLACFAVKQKS